MVSASVVVVSALVVVVAVVVVCACEELSSASEDDDSAADEESGFDEDVSFLLLDSISVPQPASISDAKTSARIVFFICNPPRSSVSFYVSFFLKVPCSVIVFSQIAVKACIYLEVRVADIYLAVYFYLTP